MFELLGLAGLWTKSGQKVDKKWTKKLKVKKSKTNQQWTRSRQKLNVGRTKSGHTKTRSGQKVDKR